MNPYRGGCWPEEGRIPAHKDRVVIGGGSHRPIRPSVSLDPTGASVLFL